MTPSLGQYAHSGDAHIAYRVIGSGPMDVVWVGWAATHMDSRSDPPQVAEFYEQVSKFCRLVLFDPRGGGMSDPVVPGQVPTIEQRMDDVRVVLDEIGSTETVLVGVDDGGPVSVLFSVTYPQRTKALVLYGTYARLRSDFDYPIGLPDDVIDGAIAYYKKNWATGVGVSILAPSVAGPEFRGQWARFQALAASPSQAEATLRMSFDSDIRPLLPTVSVPTLVAHRRGDRFIPVEFGRYLGSSITGARYVELEGEDHLPFFQRPEELIGEIEEFLLGTRSAASSDRLLATLMFTDIVGSTQRAAVLGDRNWAALMDQHDAAVRALVKRFRGHEVSATGDGFLVTFDGPARAVRCADEIRDAVKGLGLQVRIGVHTGEVEAKGDRIVGLAVNIAARVAGLAEPGEVLVSRTVTDLVVGSGIRFAMRGDHPLKGVPGVWSLFALDS